MVARFTKEFPRQKSKSPPASQTLPWSFRAGSSPERTKSSAEGNAGKSIPRSLSAGYEFPRNGKGLASPNKLTESTSSLDSRARSKGGHRRAAISSKDKNKMEESRQRAKFKRDSRSSSSTSGNEGAMGDCSSSCKEETASPSPVHVPQSKPQAKPRQGRA